MDRASEEAEDTPGIFRVSRRHFFATSSALVLGVWLGNRVRADSSAAGLAGHAEGDATPALFIKIETDGRVLLTCHRSEMGQQVWTAVAQLLGEELGCAWEKLAIVQADGDPRYGDQNTDGSRSVRKNFHRLRMAGAAARLMLERAAAEEWKVPASSCTSEAGEVVHVQTGRRLGFGALSERAALQKLPRAAEIKLKQRSAWRFINHSQASLTLPAIVRGEGKFGIDVQLPGLLHAVVLRPPQVLGKALDVDDRATLEVPGVVRTVRLPAPRPPVQFSPLGGVAVVARDTWSAILGRKALRVRWDAGPNAGYDSSEFAQRLVEQVRKPGEVRRRRGDVARALGTAKTRVAAEYYVPHLAHSAMEPPAATARWDKGKVECWGCVQAPQTARSAVAAACGIEVGDVTVHVTWLGGGFGRKSKPDHFVEAALIAREAKAPVKVTWTREDDLQHSYYHTVSAQRLEAGLDDKGSCVAFLHRTVFPPIQSTFVAGATQPTWGDLRLGASDTPFAVPNLQLETGEASAHVRIGWLRSVANIYHAFAVQSFAAELAHAAGRDPKDYLLELIGPSRTLDPNREGAEYDNYGSPLADYPIDTRRLAHVARRAAALAEWGRALPEGHGLGIAAHRSFTSYVATVVEVRVDAQRQLTIVGVWAVMDAGTVVNPDHTKSQLEGGTLFGLSNALYGEITARGGAIQQANFPAFRVMRMNEAPRHMQVELVDSDAPPGGVGEPPTPPAAPALANAIFAATGVRIRHLPIFGTNRKDRIGA